MIKKIYRAFIKKFYPRTYVKKIGLKHGSNFNIYGKVEFGTEPWILSFGNNVHITDGVKFITHDGGTLLFRKQIPDLEITKPITVGNNVYFGNDALILPGVHIGNNVIIGARAVVTKDVPDDSVVAGIPAKVIKTMDEYLSKIKKESLHLGHLKGKEKDLALKKHFKYIGNSKGIYF